MIGSSSPPHDPYSSLVAFADMAKAFADPVAFEQRMTRLVAQEQNAIAAIAQAQADTAAALKLKQDTEIECAKLLERSQFNQRHENDLCRAHVVAERAAADADRAAARAMLIQAKADTDAAAAGKVEIARRLRAMEGQ